MIPYVFDRFRQIEASTTRRESGLGLGLALARHIVELHGGTVHADSKGLGAGATFTVRIPTHVTLGPSWTPPVVVSGEDPLPHSREAPVVESLEGVRVLVVDDEHETRVLLATVLRHAGATVHMSASVREAVRALEDFRPNLVLSDIGMPEQDGYALIRQLRKMPDEGGGRIPAIAITAYATDQHRERSLAEGFTEHVAKPLRPADLLATVRNLVPRDS